MKCSALDRLARLGRDPFALLIVVLAGLGTAHILIRTAPYGAAVGYDSSFFLSTAINFLAGEGLQDLRGKPLVLWPPLFPLLLAAGGWLGIEPFAAGRFINAIAFGLTILAAGLYLRSNLQARWLGLAATATIAASLPLSEVATHFRTDSLFILLTLLALIWLAAFLQRGGRTPLLWGTVFTALAAVSRWPGVVLIGTGVLMLLVRRTPPLAIRLKHAFVFGAISSLPLAGVLTRNWAVSGTLTGKRSGSGQSLSAGLSQVADGFQAWVIPPNVPDGFGYFPWIVAGLVVAAGVVVVVSGLGLGMGGQGQRRKGSRPASPLLGLEPAVPFGGFALAYLGSMLTVVPFIIKDSIESRFLLPVYVPLLLLAALLQDQFLSIETTGRMAVAKWGLVSLVLLGALAHLGFSAYRNLRITQRAEFKDWVYNSPYWEPSEILKYIRTNLRDGKIYSNDDELTWFQDGPAALGKHQPLPLVRIHKVVPRIMRETEGTGAHIVWLLNEKSNSYSGYDILDVYCLPGVETVAELSDGVVFRVTAAEPFAADQHRTRKQRYIDQLLEQTGERVVRADWDVYRNGRKLTYLKQPCTPADVQAKFILHVTPANSEDLSRSRQRYGFDNLGFFFDRRGVRVGDQCMAIAHLPHYPIRRIRVGQWISAENRTVWDAEFPVAGD